MFFLAEGLHSMFQCPHASEQDNKLSGPGQENQQPGNLQWPPHSYIRGKKHNVPFHLAIFCCISHKRSQYRWCKLTATITATEMLLTRDLLLYLALIEAEILVEDILLCLKYNNSNKTHMHSIEHNNIFIALVATSFSHYNNHQANAIQNLKCLVTCSG